MSFRQAWLLLKAVEAMFEQPVIAAQRGGSRGGGTSLTELGRQIVLSYRHLERVAAVAAREELEDLEKKLATHAPTARRRPISRKQLKSK